MVVSPERAVPRRNRFVVTTQLAPRLPAAVIFVAASEVMLLGSGEFVVLLLRCCLLLMLWLLMLLLLRPRGRTGARPMRASSPSVGANSIISSRRNVLCVRPRRMLVLVLNSCLVFVHLRLLRSCVWLYIVVRLPLLLLLVVPSVSFSASFLPRCRPSPAVPLLRLALHLGPSPAAGGSVCVIVSTLSPPKIFGAQDTRHMPERASLICIFPRRRAGRWSWVVVTGAGAGPAPLTGGGPKPVATSHSVAGGRRLGRPPSVPEATATATTTTTVVGGPTEDISARDISWSAPPAPRPRPPTII